MSDPIDARLRVAISRVLNLGLVPLRWELTRDDRHALAAWCRTLPFEGAIPDDMTERGPVRIVGIPVSRTYGSEPSRLVADRGGLEHSELL